VTAGLNKYDTVSPADLLKQCVTDFSTWYIRRSRDRVGPGAQDLNDRDFFYQTCYTVLVELTKLFAPFAPFISEAIFKNLTNEESVHLTDWPAFNKEYIREEIHDNMVLTRKIVELALNKRQEQQLKVKQPLACLTVSCGEGTISIYTELVKDEVNVKSVEFKKNTGDLRVALDTNISRELKEEGEAREIVRRIQIERKKLATSLTEKVNVALPVYPKAFENYIIREALIHNLTIAAEFSVSRLRS
jgi:isoleucyl-tRNA synthetase